MDAGSDPKLLVSCVGENQPLWFRKMENLVLSLRQFGEASAHLPVVVNVVEGVEPAFADAMARLDADVRVVGRVDPRFPSANKLRMLELAETDDFDVLLMLDCDLIVRGDLAPEAPASRLRIMPGLANPFSDETWGRMYDTFGLARPRTRLTMTTTGESGYPYYNSGVLFVPRQDCSKLLRSWNLYRDRCHDLEAAHPELFVSQYKQITKRKLDQPSLPFALADAGLEVDPLPVNLNLRTSARGTAKAYRTQWGPPFIFHYHRHMDDNGFVAPAWDPRINPYLDEFNRARADWSGLALPAPPPHHFRRDLAIAAKRLRYRISGPESSRR